MPFDPVQADLACNFFELLLKHTADEWWGKPFVLTPWQLEATRAIFGNVAEDERRLINLAYIEVPAKTGKTEWAAGLLLMGLVLAPYPGFQAYGAASAQRQSLNVYRAACKMVEQSPILQRELRILRGTNRIIKRNDPDTFYAAIAADGDITDGCNPAMVVADEVHRWRTRKQLENWDVLTLKGIARRQSTLTIAITTAGVKNESPLAWRLHEKTLKIREGVYADEHFYGRIYSAEPGDDWTSEKTWIKANPSLKENGGFLELEKIRAVYQSSLTNPDEQVAFRRYYLNLWDEKANRAIPMDQWNACGGDWNAHGWPGIRDDHEFLKRFVDRKCWVGVDLSMTTDMSAVAAVFPDETGGVDVLPFFWMPDANIRKRELRDGMPYRRWAEEGYLELSPGSAINYADIKSRLKWIAEMFDLQEICFDPWNTREMSVQLIDEGFRCNEVRQRYTELSEPTKKLLTLIACKKIRHGNHPILSWNASCLCTVSDGNDLIKPIKPDRESEQSRIDGIMATIDALARTILNQTNKSVYACPETAVI